MNGEYLIKDFTNCEDQKYYSDMVVHVVSEEEMFIWLNNAKTQDLKMNSLKTFRRTKKTENSLGDKKRSTIAGKSSKISSIAGSKTICF